MIACPPVLDALAGLERHPDVHGIVVDTREAAWSDGHDRVCPLAEPKRPADDVGGTAEPLLPERMADYYSAGIGGVSGRGENAERRPDAEDVEVGLAEIDRLEAVRVEAAARSDTLMLVAGERLRNLAADPGGEPLDRHVVRPQQARPTISAEDLRVDPSNPRWIVDVGGGRSSRRSTTSARTIVLLTPTVSSAMAANVVPRSRISARHAEAGVLPERVDSGQHARVAERLPCLRDAAERAPCGGRASRDRPRWR